MSAGTSVRARMLGFAFLDEVGPLITLHTLWFADHGVTAGQISAVFVLWAFVGVVLEVPSGALADRVDRRKLVAASLWLRALGFVVWLQWPTVTGLAVGAVLWATHSAFASGAWEALIFDQLTALGEQEDYQRTHARIEQASTAGIFTGTVAAWGLLHLEVPLAWLGWATVVLHAPSWLAIRTLPAVPMALDDDDDGALTFASWWRTLKAGVAQVAARPHVSRLVAVAAALGGLLLLDEYVPLLGRARDADDDQVALLVLAVWFGGLAGTEAAARFPSTARTVALVLGISTAAAIAALVVGPWWLLPLLAVGYGAQFFAWIHADARLQERLDAPSRATATSVRELLSNGVSMGILAVVGVLAVGEDPTPGVLGMLAAILVVAVMVARWVPDAAQRTSRS